MSLKRYDETCRTCGWVDEIWAMPGDHPPCPNCGSTQTERIFLGGYAVWGDEIPGGRWVNNLGPAPVYVESKSQLKHEMAMRGLTECVRHVGVPGSDRSPHTTRHV